MFVAIWQKIRTDGRNSGIPLGLLLVYILLLTFPLNPLAKCPNWCSQRGICTGPDDDAFCICEMGYQGDDCGTRMCPKGDDPLTTDQADRTILLRTAADGGPISGELSFTFNGETTTLNANAHRAGDRECASALQLLPNIDWVSCRRGPVSEVGGAEYTIALLSFPTMPWENNHYGHYGNPALEAFSCNISVGSEGDQESDVFPSCELVDLVTEDVKEYVECSRHGTCIRETGRCECNFGFKGDACDDISDSDDAQVILAEGPFFTGSTLKLRANRGFHPDFDFIRALAGPHDVMTLAGTGDLTLHKGSLFIQGHQTPGSPKNTAWKAQKPPRALEVLGGSLGVLGGGAEIRSSRSNAPALAISVEVDEVMLHKKNGEEGSNALIQRTGRHKTRERGAQFSFSGAAALSVNVRNETSMMKEAPSEWGRFRLLELSVGGENEKEEREFEAGDTARGVAQEPKVLMSVRGDGGVFMGGGGGMVLGEGDLEVSQGDASFQGNVSVGDSLSVGPGGMAVADRGSIRVLDGGLHIIRSTTRATAGSTEEQDVGGDAGSSGAVGVLSATQEDFSGDVLRVDASGAGAAVAGAGLLRASAGGRDVFEVKATGATSVKSGGLDVKAGGLRVASGGVTVESGGLSVDGGLRIRSGTIIIEDDDRGVDDSDGETRRGERGGLEVAHGGIRAGSSDASTPALTASATGEGFGGSVFSVAAPASPPSNSFRLVQDLTRRRGERGDWDGRAVAVQATVGGGRDTETGCQRETEVGDLYHPSKSSIATFTGDVNDLGDASADPCRGRDVFVVDGTGKITAVGGLETGARGHIVAGGRLAARGATVLEMRQAPRYLTGDGSASDGGSSVVVVDASDGTFFEISDDGRSGFPNELYIKGETMPGQVLLLHNSDAEPTSGAAIIPSGYTVLLIHDGTSWRDLRVIEAAATELRGVTTLTAANNLDIGDFTLKARHMVCSGNDAGGVALFGGGGLLTADKGLTFDSASRTLEVPRLRASEVVDAMDFKGNSARNVAIVNATIDRIPFLKTARLIVESAVARPHDGASSPYHPYPKIAGPALGLAVLDNKGELSRGDSIAVHPGGTLEVKRIGPHHQAGDVNFQGHAARNLSLSEVSDLTGLDRLEVRELFLASSSPYTSTDSAKTTMAMVRGSLAIVTSEGELRSTGDAFYVDHPKGGNGTLLAPRIGPHDVAGDVDFLGNMVRNAVLESPAIRGIVSHLRTEALSIVAPPSMSRGLVAVFGSSEEHHFDTDDPLGGSKFLGKAELVWQDGALQNIRLGGTTTLEGDLDLRGHRLLNFDLGARGVDHVEDLTIQRALILDHQVAFSGSLLAIGAGGLVTPVDPEVLFIRASTASISGSVTCEQLNCRGPADIGGNVFVAGDVTVRGNVELGAGMDARGATIANAQLESVKFRGGIVGDVKFDGTVAVETLRNDEGGGLVAVGAGGTLSVAHGVKYDNEDGGVLVVKKLSGHQVVGDVDFAGRALLSPNLDFSSGGSISALARLRVGEGGLKIDGMLHATSNMAVEGSVTVSGAVMGHGPYMDISDGRFKTDVRDLSVIEAFSAVRGLRAVKYVLKSDGFPPSGAAEEGKRQRYRHEHGFIAQEVENVVPEVVSEDAQGFKTVAYSRLVPILARTLSAVLDRLDGLEERKATAACKSTWLATMGNLWKTPFGLGIVHDKRVGNEGEDNETIAERHGDDVMNEALTGDGLSGRDAPTLKSVAGRTTVGGYRDVEADKRFRRRYQQEENPAAMLAQGHLLAENTALKVRVSELEEKMLDVERRIALIFGAGEMRITGE